MTHQVGDTIKLDGTEFVVTQISIRAKDNSRKVTLQEVIPEPEFAETEHGTKLGL